MNNLLNREPVMTVGGIVGAIMATLAVLVSLGVIKLEPEQMSAIETALVAVASLLFPLVGAWIARGQVTPVNDPRTAAGKPAQLVEK